MAFCVKFVSVATVLANTITVCSTLKFPFQKENNLLSCLFSEVERLHTDLNDIINQLTIVPQCGDGLWHRAVYLNMTDISQNCPVTWREITDPVRACGRMDGAESLCSSHFFPISSLQYRKICGRANGFQEGTTDAFANFPSLPVRVDSTTATTDDNYVDGLSITHGSQPRSHIWTFASGNSDGTSRDVRANCPCAGTAGASPPTFVRNDYFCESGNGGRLNPGGLLNNDPLWDGEQCEGECCSNGKSLPWFNVELPYPTSDDIEVRICSDESILNEDVPVRLLEIYIQ